MKSVDNFVTKRSWKNSTIQNPRLRNSIESVKSEAESIKKDLDITKGLSEYTLLSHKTLLTPTLEDSADPIEKLPTNDPAARTAGSTGSTKSTTAPASKTTEQTDSTNTEPGKTSNTTQTSATADVKENES